MKLSLSFLRRDWSPAAIAVAALAGVGLVAALWLVLDRFDTRFPAAVFEGTKLRLAVGQGKLSDDGRWTLVTPFTGSVAVVAEPISIALDQTQLIEIQVKGRTSEHKLQLFMRDSSRPEAYRRIDLAASSAARESVLLPAALTAGERMIGLGLTVAHPTGRGLVVEALAVRPATPAARLQAALSGLQSLPNRERFGGVQRAAEAAVIDFPALLAALAAGFAVVGGALALRRWPTQRVASAAVAVVAVLGIGIGLLDGARALRAAAPLPHPILAEIAEALKSHEIVPPLWIVTDSVALSREISLALPRHATHPVNAIEAARALGDLPPGGTLLVSQSTRVGFRSEMSLLSFQVDGNPVARTADALISTPRFGLFKVR